MSEENNMLFYLSELPDYKVAEDYYDIRGWPVNDATNRKIGIVDGLLVNKVAQRVVYLDVEVDSSLINESRINRVSSAHEGVYEFSSRDGDNHLIIPVEMVILDEGKKEVHARKIKYETFAKADRFRKEAGIDEIYESNILRLYTEQDTTAIN
jgi:hypothetical protein